MASELLGLQSMLFESFKLFHTREVCVESFSARPFSFTVLGGEQLCYLGRLM